MALKDNKIVAWSAPVVNQPDRPQIDADKLKAVFDSNSNEIKDALNATIDALSNPGGIDLLGVSNADGITGRTITEQLASVKKSAEEQIDGTGKALSDRIDEVENAADTKLSETEVKLTERINEVEQAFEDSNIPAGGAQGQYLKKRSAVDFDLTWDTPQGGGDMLRTIYDVNQNGTVDDAEKLGGQTPEYYAKKAELTGSFATGNKVVTLNGIINGTALTQLELFGKSTQEGTPSPDAPIEIESVVADDVSMRGKNLLNADGFVLNANTDSKEISDEGYTISVTGSKTYSYCRIDLSPNLFVGKEIVIKYDSLETPVQSDAVQLKFNENGKTVYKNVRNKSDGASLNVSIPSNATDIALNFYANNSSTALTNAVTATVKGLMICYADENDLTWEPYKDSVTYPITPEITLRGIPVTSGGNYTDENGQQWICDTYDMATGEYVQRIGEYVVTGSEGKSSGGTNKGYIWFASADTTSKLNVRLYSVLDELYLPLSISTDGKPRLGICTHGRCDQTWNGAGFIQAVRVASNIKTSYISFDPSGIASTLDEFIAWLAAQYTAGTPVTIQYALAEPVVIRRNPVYMPAHSRTTKVMADGDIKVEYNNILKSAKRLPVFVLLSKDAWTDTMPYTQSVSITGMTEDMRPVADVVLSEATETAIAELEAWALVDKIETGANRITVTCYNAPPQTDIQIVLKEMN